MSNHNLCIFVIKNQAKLLKRALAAMESPDCGCYSELGDDGCFDDCSAKEITKTRTFILKELAELEKKYGEFV